MGKVSRVTLTKKGRLAVLQGMRHVAPLVFYTKIQRAIDRAAGRGSQIFKEGIKTSNLPPPNSFNEKLIRQFWIYWFESDRLSARLSQLQLERESLFYPESVINVDIDLAETAQLLEKNGFRCRLPVGLFKFLNSSFHIPLVDAIENGIYAAEGSPRVPKNFEEYTLAMLFQSYGKKLHPIMMTYRDRVAADNIRTKDNGSDIFVTYGNAHIPGLIEHFRVDGWKVKEIKEVYVG